MYESTQTLNTNLKLVLSRMFLLLAILFAFELKETTCRATIPALTGDFEFLTPRYSDFIGGFEAECSINSTVVTLLPEEDLCNINTINTNVSEKVLVVFGVVSFDCVEEVAYENAIELGALVLLDAAPVPPGVSQFIHNLGQKFQFGDVPFLQVGSEFFLSFAILESPLFGTLDNSTIFIDGCADVSPWTPCFDGYFASFLFFSLVSFYGLYLSISIVRRMKPTPSSQPRRFLIAYEAFWFGFTALVFFFGVSLRGYRPLLTGEVLPAEVKDVIGSIQIVGNSHATMLCAVYWSALRKGCYSRGSETEEYWRKNFFRSPWILVISAVAIFLVNSFLIGVQAFTEGDVDEFRRRSLITVIIDFLVNLWLFFNMSLFVIRLNQTMSLSNTGKLRSRNQTRYEMIQDFLFSLWDVIKGNASAFKVNSSHPANSQINSRLVKLTVHLSKWLIIFVLITTTASGLLFFGAVNAFPLFLLQDDPDVCQASTYTTAFAVIKVFTFYCVVLGLAGPKSDRTTTNKTAKLTVQSSSNDDTKHRTKFYSSFAKAPPGSPPESPQLSFDLRSPEKYIPPPDSHSQNYSLTTYQNQVLSPTPGRGRRKKTTAHSLGSTTAETDTNGTKYEHSKNSYYKNGFKKWH
eukprot:snap_masked-scaffold_7-processed-gene-1.32-mRNA-1 protein AED:1.00 eAED:1.00 QI:0/-1/0/0/-1/1/1/0/632